MDRSLLGAAAQGRIWSEISRNRYVFLAIALLACITDRPTSSEETQEPVHQHASEATPEDSVHFAKSTDCALCHSFSNAARAMRDEKNRNVAPYDLWSGSMMANSAIDPYWKAAVSAEVAATPSQKVHIEEVCSRCHAPMAAPFAPSPDGEILAFLRGNQSKVQLGKDGVSCTVCHQISPDNLGTDESFTGGFQFNNKSEIYGPHADPVTMPMQRHVDYTPTYGSHMLSSSMCATCHTVITGSFDKQGEETHTHLHEQVPYLEWRNSIFNDEVDTNSSTARSCQTCHMPQTDIDGNTISTRIAHNPGGRDFPFLNPREPYGRHTFAGGNVFMTQLLRDNRQILGISTPAEAFDRVIADSRKLLQQKTATIQLTHVPTTDRSTVVNVEVNNLSGHKFPTAYPSRRAWIEMVVRDESGIIRFTSGQTNQQGQMIDASGKVLATETAHGPVQSHLNTVTDSSQVQIYESLMEDSEGALTFALLRGGRFMKDNRLLPQGWREDHEHAEATRPQGLNHDDNFVAGKDSTHYRMSLPPGKYSFEARLLFQSLSSRYMAELFEIDTPEIKTFQKLYEGASKSPEIIDTAKMELVVPD